MQEFKEYKQLSIDMHCSHTPAFNRGFIIDSSLVDWKQTLHLFSFTIHLFYNMPICSINRTFFFTIHLFYEYVESNLWNTCECEKPLQQEQTFFLQCFLFFFACLFLVY